MGQREVKRVPVDFGHPVGEVWPGYVPPEPRPCPAGDACVHGVTRDRDWLEHWVHILLVAATSPDHPWVGPSLEGSRPTGALREVTSGLAGRQSRIFGHDAIDRWQSTRALLAAAGLDGDWGLCPACGGRAYHPDDQPDQDAWQRTDPPDGDGWQLWETTSEGSPRSPVFATARELAEWAADNTTLWADVTATADEWETIIVDGDVDTASTMAFTARQEARP